MKTAQQVVSEKDFMASVVAVARARGWRVYHTFDSRRSDPGFPDLIMVRGDRLLAVECKRMTGMVSPEQHAWLYALAGIQRVDACVWRPSDWDTIHAVLEGE